MIENTTTTGYTITTTGMILKPETNPVPRESRALIETRAVQLLDGWAGQLLIGGKIVWETMDRYPNGDDALEIANHQLLDRLAEVFQ